MKYVSINDFIMIKTNKKINRQIRYWSPVEDARKQREK